MIVMGIFIKYINRIKEFMGIKKPINTDENVFVPELYNAYIYRDLENKPALKQMCKAKGKRKMKENGKTIYFADLAETIINGGKYSGDNG